MIHIIVQTITFITNFYDLEYILVYYISMNQLITELVDLTKKIYKWDVSNNIFIDKGDLVFYSDDHFDWYAEGIFVYQEIEAEKGVTYVVAGTSDLYDYDESDGNVEINIRAEYQKILSKHYTVHCVYDRERDDDDDAEYIYTDFIVKEQKC
jgi:hypothetical protein